MRHVNVVSLHWVFTAAVLLHIAEEALFLPSWSRRVRRWYRPVENAEFHFAALVASIALVALTLAATLLPGAAVQYAFAGYVVAMLANALVPHLAITIALREYMPGMATAWLLVVPIGFLYLWAAVRQHIVDVPTLLWVSPLVALCLLAAIPALLLLGRRLSNRYKHAG
jgi:hypothetical protein